MLPKTAKYAAQDSKIRCPRQQNTLPGEFQALCGGKAQKGWRKMKNGYEEENRAESRAEENQENQKTRNEYTINWENDVPAEDAAALKSQRGRRKFRLK